MGLNFSSTPEPQCDISPPEQDGVVYVSKIQAMISSFDFELFKTNMGAVANAKEIKLIWQTAKTGPNGDGTGLWMHNMLIRKIKCENGVRSDGELKTVDEIFTEMLSKNPSKKVITLYLRTSTDVIGWYDQLLYFNFQNNDTEEEKKTTETKEETKEGFDEVKFTNELKEVAKAQNVDLVMVAYPAPAGWSYNVSVASKTAAEVFAEMMIPTDRTLHVAAKLRIEPTLPNSHACSKLVYYNFEKD